MSASSLTSSPNHSPPSGGAQNRSFGASYVGGLWTLYLLTLRQHMHGRRWMVMAVLFLVPAGLAILLRAIADEVPPLSLEFMLAMMLMPQVLLPLTSLLYASGMIQDEQEEQTITYLLIRPIPKWALYLAKLAATLTTTVLVTVVFTLLTYAAIYVGGEGSPDNVVVRAFKAAAIHSLAVVAYCCLFGLLSLVVNRVLVVGILFTAVVEGLLANLPFSLRLGTVIYYTRLIAYRELPFLIPRWDEEIENRTALVWQLDVARDPKLLEHPQIATCFAVLLLGSLVCALLAAWICSRREFHVKTPEKA